MDTCRGKVLDWVTGLLASEEDTAAPEHSPQRKRQVAQRPLLGPGSLRGDRRRTLGWRAADREGGEA